MTRGPRQLNGFDLHSMVFSPMTICDANGWRTDKAFISITHSDEKPGDPPRPCLLPEPFRQPCRGRHQHRARALHDPRFPQFDLHPADFPFLRRIRLLRLRFLLPDALRNRPARLFLFQHSLPLMRKPPFPGAIRLHSHFPDEHRHDTEHIAAHPDFETGERGHGYHTVSAIWRSSRALLSALRAASTIAAEICTSRITAL